MMNSARNNVRLYLLLTSYFLFLVSFSIFHVKDAYAHKVQMFAHAEGDRVFVEGYFPDGKKAMNSEVTVYDNKSGEELLEGKTDDMGKFSFKVPRKTDLRISLNASLGHKTESVLPADDLDGVGGNKSSAAVAATSMVKAKVDKNKPVDTGKDEMNPMAKQPQADPVEVQLMIEKGVERGISPLLRGFSECKEHVFFSEIIGGIGYIFGILGMVLYFKARKSQ